MTPREHKALMNQFERLHPMGNVYVTERVTKYMQANPNPKDFWKDCVIFCLESTPLNDPILPKIKQWVDEANALCNPASNAHRMAEVETYIAKVCGNCGESDNLMTCNKCRLIRYCSPECQRANWKLHKKTCRPSAPTNTFTIGNETHVFLSDEEHNGTVEVVMSDQNAILKKFPLDYTEEEVTDIFTDMALHGYTSAKARTFIENAAANGGKVKRVHD